MNPYQPPHSAGERRTTSARQPVRIGAVPILWGSLAGAFFILSLVTYAPTANLATNLTTASFFYAFIFSAFMVAISLRRSKPE